MSNQTKTTTINFDSDTLARLSELAQYFRSELKLGGTVSRSQIVRAAVHHYAADLLDNRPLAIVSAKEVE